MIRLILVAVAIGGVLARVHAQDLVRMAEVSFPFGMLLKTAYLETNAFTAKTIVELGEPHGESVSWPVTLRYSGLRLSSSFSLADLPRISAETRQRMRALSLDEVSTIVDLPTEQLTVMFPGVEGYLKMQLPAAGARLSQQLRKAQAIRKKLLGKEICQGVECQKVELIDPTTTNVTVIAWIGADRFPMKLELASRDIKMAIRVQSVDMTNSIPNEVPAQFVRYATSAEILKAATRRAEDTRARSDQKVTAPQ
jgi:hypothetical protein